MNPTYSDSETASVLIVEDERDLADLYASWLNDSYIVSTAYDGDEALDKLDEQIDVVLLDRRMPGTSGDEVLDYIRKHKLDIRVAIVSAVSPDFDVIGMGFDDYLVKPVDNEELHDTIERMLTRATYDDALKELEQLVAQKAVLEVEKTNAELQEHDEYRKLERRIEKVQRQADTAVADFNDEDFEVTFRSFEFGSPNRDIESDEDQGQRK